MLATRLTELFGLEHPIVLAPMANGATSGHLAAAVCAAGGLGLFGGIHSGGPEWVREQIRFMRTRAGERWGVGFITWMIPNFEANFQVCLDEHVPIMAFSFGDPTQYVVRAKAAGAKVLCQVQTIESARVALEAGTNVLVVQGNEAGGHTGQLGTLPFLAQVLELSGSTPVIASGGIGSGRALAAVLAAGAEGAWLGTPLLATHEAVEVAETYKSALSRAMGRTPSSLACSTSCTTCASLQRLRAAPVSTGSPGHGMDVKRKCDGGARNSRRRIRCRPRLSEIPKCIPSGWDNRRGPSTESGR